MLLRLGVASWCGAGCHGLTCGVRCSCEVWPRYPITLNGRPTATNAFFLPFVFWLVLESCAPCNMRKEIVPCGKCTARQIGQGRHDV